MGESLWMNDCSSGGMNVYLVMRGHSVYDEFVSTKPLTWSQQADIIAGYREALDNHERDDK